LSHAFISGGGLKMGQVIGTSTANAEDAKDRPVHLQEVFATLYHTLGLNVKDITLQDPNGRPQFLVDHRKAIDELV
jgi:hypothetical protein